MDDDSKVHESLEISCLMVVTFFCIRFRLAILRYFFCQSEFFLCYVTITSTIFKLVGFSFSLGTYPNILNGTQPCLTSLVISVVWLVSTRYRCVSNCLSFLLEIIQGFGTFFSSKVFFKKTEQRISRILLPLVLQLSIIIRFCSVITKAVKIIMFFWTQTKIVNCGSI